MKIKIFAIIGAICTMLCFDACKSSKKTQASKEPTKVEKKSTTKTKSNQINTDNIAIYQTEQGKIDQKLIKEYLAKNALSKYGVTKSGIYYVVEKSGTAQKPTINNNVDCHYKGYLLDGTQFDSSYDRGQSTQFPLSGVIQGWQEGIPTIGKGGKVKLLIPSGLAYGSRGIGNIIKPNSVLVFDVELIDFQ